MSSELIPIVPRNEYRRLQRRALAAQRRDQSEVCGVALIARSGELTFCFLTNISKGPGRFEFTMKEVASARRELAPKGLLPFAEFHSHPIMYAIPGPGDLKRGFYKGREIIYDVCGCEMRLWRKVWRPGGAVAREEALFVCK